MSYQPNPYQPNPFQPQQNPYSPQSNPGQPNPGQPNPYQANPYQANPYQQYPGYVPVPQPDTNVLGLVGFIVSIVSLMFTCGLLSPIGLILSLIGTFKAPRGLAIAGTVLGVLGCGLLGFFIFAIASADSPSFRSNTAFQSNNFSSYSSSGTTSGPSASAGPGGESWRTESFSGNWDNYSFPPKSGDHNFDPRSGYSK